MLEGKVAVITGGTRGIGYATVKLFLDNGAKVALFGSKAETVNIAIKSLKEINPKYQVIGFYPTLYNEKKVSNVYKEIKNTFGHIDILVNNAGISSSTPLEDYTIEEYDNIMNINVKGVFVNSKIALPYLKETKGNIVNVSSMVSIYGQPSGVMYPASKFAVNGITKSLSRELAKYGIRVNAVAPGITKTDMVSSLPDEVIKPLINTIPLGRIGESEDVAKAIMFLASNQATYITGEILSVDGAARS